MRSLSLAALAWLLAGASPALAQKSPDKILPSVKKSFQDLDRDKSGSLTMAEARRSNLSAELFRTHDADSSGGIDQDEFIVMYRGLLKQVKRPVPADLEAEVARIETRRKAVQEEKRKEAEAAKKAEADAQKKAASQPAAAKKQPAAGTAKPAAAKKQPNATKTKPAANKPQPAKGPQPVAQKPSGAQAPRGAAPGGAAATKRKGPAIRKAPQAKQAPNGPGQKGQKGQKGKAGNGKPAAGNDALTPDKQAQLDARIRAAREKWLKQMEGLAAKADKAGLGSFGANLPPDLLEDLLTRVSSDRNQALRDWASANPQHDITNLDPKIRTRLAELIKSTRDGSRDAWAAEKRAELVERRKRAKQGAGNGGAGKGGAGKKGAGKGGVVRKVKTPVREKGAAGAKTPPKTPAKKKG